MHVRSILLALSIIPLSGIAQDPVGYLALFEGDTIRMYPSHDPKFPAFSMGNGYAYYYEQGKKRESSVSTKRVKEARLEKQRWVQMPEGSSNGMVRLQEVMLEDDKYLLTSFASPLHNYLALCVLDKATQKYEVKRQRHSFSEREDRELFNTVVKKYFGDCPDGVAAVQHSLDFSYRKDVFEVERSNTQFQRMFRDVADHQCK